MGTKNNPAPNDCYARAEPDEPMFVLLGRDVTASLVVAFWHELRKELGETEPAVLAEALQCSEAMKQWAIAKGKEPDLALHALQKFLKRMLTEGGKTPFPKPVT